MTWSFYLTNNSSLGTNNLQSSSSQNKTTNTELWNQTKIKSRLSWLFLQSLTCLMACCCLALFFSIDSITDDSPPDSISESCRFSLQEQRQINNFLKLINNSSSLNRGNHDHGDHFKVVGLKKSCQYKQMSRWVFHHLSCICEPSGALKINLFQSLI